jgi:signal transduction histidine kinase
MKISFKMSLFLFVSVFFLSLAQENPKVEMSSVRINGETSQFSDSLYVTSKDSITFEYFLNSKSNTKEPFLFRAAIFRGNDSSVSNTGTNVISYKNLSYDNYRIRIDAFDLGGNWSADAVNAHLIVNDKLAKFYRTIQKQEERLSSQDSTINELKSKLNSAQSNKSKILSDSLNIILIGVIIILVVVIIIIIAIFRKKLSTSAESSATQKSHKKTDRETAGKTEKDFDKLLEENAVLNTELSALRGQIEALQFRSEEMKRQNNELKKNLEKINNKTAELEDLQTQKDDLFALIIHDIKNPAALIKSLVELLTSYDLSATEQQEIIKDIASTTSKIVQLSQEVSKIIAFESNKIGLNYEKVDYLDLVKDVHQRSNIAAKQKSIELFTDLKEGLPEIQIDVFKVDEILENLVSNAIKFTNPGGVVRIKVYDDKDNIITEVNDNGQGLSEDDIKDAFKRGKRLSAQPTAGEHSTGLGLWIVKKLVEAHKGRVWVKSSLGKGSTFYYALPKEQN